ncbi:MAG: ribbon-helix-helix protein, CopG family [Thermoplasmatales archaeon]|nr:ribbon-helix-helix protein, CopG family [Thermoplasmatales archaeon]
MKKIRVSATLPYDLLEKFDEIYKEMGHKNRSNAISSAIHEYITSHEFLKEKGIVAGAIVFTYNHSNLTSEMLTEAQHKYNEVINAAMHIHLNKEQCLEIIAFRGKANKIKGLLKKISGIKGVISVNIVTSA